MKCSPKEIRVPKAEEDEFLAQMFKALAHPVRVKLLKILIDKGTCISGDLAEEFDLAQSTVSEHLRFLKEANLVDGTIDGPRRCYCINGGVLKKLQDLVNAL